MRSDERGDSRAKRPYQKPRLETEDYLERESFACQKTSTAGQGGCVIVARSS